MVFFAVVAALFAGYGTAYLASEDVRYLTRAGFEETRILQSRQPIARLVRRQRHRSRRSDRRSGWCSQTRDYAARLGLEAKETYTTYSDVGRDTLLLVLQAAPKDCICPYTWKYPIVGRIPYKGFFDPAAARREADRFALRGLRHLSPALGRLLHARVVRGSSALYRASRGTRSSWPPPCFTRSRTTRST